MKKYYIILFYTLLNLTQLFAETAYHFREGFVSSSPTGWIRQCSATSSLNHTGLDFSAAYASKFDAAGSGRYNKNLISPQVAGADTVSFYVSKNANATHFMLYVGKIIGNDTTIVRSFNAYEFPNKSTTPGFVQIKVPINDASNLKIIFYAVESTYPVNAGWFVVDDIELSTYTGEVAEPDGSVESFVANFGDGSWGTPVSSIPASGSYPSTSTNGFNLVKAVLLTGSVTCETGEKHINRILFDKGSQGGALEFPALKTVGEIEIHAATGTEGMSFRLEEWIEYQWQLIGTYTTRKSPDSIYVIPVKRNTETRLRIANNTGSGLYVYKIATRTYQQTIDLTLRSSSPAENEVCFYNLKNEITLNFNKEVALGSGTFLLNGVSIPLNSSVVTGDMVIIPIQLEGTPSLNKNYTFTASAGCFVEKDSITNLSKAFSINFQTLKTVSYPSVYSAQMDVVYKNVNSPNTRMDIYYPTHPDKPVPVVINMHGGGWNHGFKEEQGGFNMYFNQGYAVANVEYRMTNEAKAPAAVEDVRAAMIYLLHHAEEFNIDKRRIIFQGGSAGGHLALTAGYLQNNRLFDNDTEPYADEIQVLAVIDKYGPAKLSDFMFYTSLVNWLGANATNQAFVNSISPIDMIDADTPPTYIIHGDADPTVPYSQSVALQIALQEAGVKNQFTTVQGGGHGGFPSAYNTQMENEIIQFLNEVIAEQLTSVHSLQKTNNVQIGISGTKIILYTDLDTSTFIYNCLGEALINSKEKLINLGRGGVFLVRTANDEGESLYKVLIR